MVFFNEPSSSPIQSICLFVFLYVWAIFKVTGGLLPPVPLFIIFFYQFKIMFLMFQIILQCQLIYFLHFLGEKMTSKINLKQNCSILQLHFFVVILSTFKKLHFQVRESNILPSLTKQFWASGFDCLPCIAKKEIESKDRYCSALTRDL